MKFLPAAAVRRLDQRALEAGQPLMGRAAHALAGRLRELASACGWAQPVAWLLAGAGNNGGDASRLAALLHGIGWRVRLSLAARPEDLQGDALAAWQHARAAGVATDVWPAEADWALDGDTLPLADVVVDGLLGTGATGAPRGVVAAALAAAQRAAASALVVAIDVPSGFDADTGQAAGAVLPADLTLSLGAPKAGFAAPDAMALTGSVDNLPLGFDPAAVQVEETALPAPLRFLDRATAALPRRARAVHKGQCGRVLILGGSRGCTGAIGLAARAAVRGGAGLVTVLTPASQVPVVAAHCPEAMVHPGPETEDGALSAELWADWQRRIDDFDAILAGPGMGTGPDTMQIMRKIFTGTARPVVLDADAINVFEGRAHWMEKSCGPVVVTPHPGELARLLGLEVAAVQADRLAAVRQAAAATGATVVLKGSGTLVSQATGDTWLNLTGNPGLASGGTGDVLAGLLAALLGQGLAPLAAARTAAHAHGWAGDLAAWRGGQAGLSASDVIAALPAALRVLQGR